MPKLMQSSEDIIMSVPGPGTFQFSAVRPENLGATEYTLVSIVIDVTGSVTPFANELLKMLKFIIKACGKNPRADNLMVRVTTFNTDIYETHGFKELCNINPDDYQGFSPSGMTALFDATYDAVGATIEYAKSLIEQDFDVNGAVYIITDGVDNASRINPVNIAEIMNRVKRDEEIESLVSVLVGLSDPNDSGDYKRIVTKALSEFQANADITQFVDVGDATPGKLAKLGNFVSQSISSQSQSLGTGSASVPLTF